MKTAARAAVFACLLLPVAAQPSDGGSLGPVPRGGFESSGGETTVLDATRSAFSYPARNISEDHRPAFFVGNSFFNQNWVAAPASVAGRDGLGPLFNTRSCSACHFKDGRSRPPEPGEPLSTMLLRISVPGQSPRGEPLPEPTYGAQIQGRAILGVKPEAEVVVAYTEVRGGFADGGEFTLRQPTYSLRRLGYGPIATNLLTSPRVAPTMIGLGLLEAVPEKALLSLAEKQSRGPEGIRGRVNWVWDQAALKRRPGRFGWKAEQPSIAQQVATAFLEDMGLTSAPLPVENQTPPEALQIVAPPSPAPEVSDAILAQVILYSSLLAVPARRSVELPEVQRGEELFRRLRCAACHEPTLETAAQTPFAELSRQTFHPYTDLLLHDMGEGLSDGRPSFGASGRDWRTAPLWGLGLISKVNGHTFLLHDGRARNAAEAVLWHGGEAAGAREAFRLLPAAERLALLAFLESL